MKIPIQNHAICLLLFIATAASAQNWTQFRGTSLNGLAPDQNPPLQWTPDSNLVWKTNIPGAGWSSPVVFGQQIWLTTSTNEGSELFAVCIDKSNGEIVHNILLFRPDSVYRKHAVNSYATPTPCIDEKYVYLNFGSYGTACLETATATIVWKREDLLCNHIQGPGASPILYKNMLILHYEGIDNLFIIALDKTTGKTIWKTDRPAELYEPLDDNGRKAYITPLVITVNGRDLLISNGSAVCIAYDPETGEEVWRIIQGEDSTISMPVYENGIVYFYTGFVAPPDGEKYSELFAVNPEGQGNVTGTNIIWRMKSPILQLLSPLVHNGLLYTIDSNGNLMCMDARTGEIFYQERLRSKYNASPVLAGGHIYFSSTNGKTLVIREGKQLVIVAENQLDGQIWASPAVINDQLLIRTSSYLYLVGNK